jgi:hypothetical protein
MMSGTPNDEEKTDKMTWPERSNVVPSIEATRLGPIYDQMWTDAAPELAAGHIDSDVVPQDGSRRWGVSAVVLPTTPVRDRLEDAAEQLGRRAGTNHIFYDRSNLHSTLRSIEFYRSDLTTADPRVATYICLLRDLASRFASIPILYKGLTATKTGVMAQGWDIGGVVQDFRLEFHDLLRACDLLTGPEAQAVRQTAHASLMVFTGELLHANALADFIALNRQTDYGISVSMQINLVIYVRTKSTVALEFLESTPLVGDPSQF